MARLFPEHAEFLLKVNELIFDLMKIFSNGLYQHPNFKGSSSIKKVLPVLCPDLDYEELDIQNGSIAALKWHLMTEENSEEEEAKKVFSELLEYCKLDTWAMVRIWQGVTKISPISSILSSTIYTFKTLISTLLLPFL